MPNYTKKTKLSDPFIKEVHETWTEINFENAINFMEHFRQQYFWQNSLIKIENKPIYLRNWFKKRNRTGKTYNEKRVPVSQP